MENLYLAPSFDTPEVSFDFENGRLKLCGRSILDGSVEFYKRLNKWIDDYCIQPKANTIVEVKFDYFNTSSSKCLLTIFKKLERLNSDVSGVEIHWVHREDDIDMLEAGEDFKAIISLPFIIISSLD